MCWKGEELLPRRRAVRQIFEEHLVTAGNTVWTSGNRRLHHVSSILSGFLLCLAVHSLRSLGLLYMVISWGKRTFIHFFWHEGSAWFHWGIPLLSLRWVCGLPSTAANACFSTRHVKELMSYNRQKYSLHWNLLGCMPFMNFFNELNQKGLVWQIWRGFLLVYIAVKVFNLKIVFFSVLDATYGESTLSFGRWHKFITIHSHTTSCHSVNKEFNEDLLKMSNTSLLSFSNLSQCLSLFLTFSLSLFFLLLFNSCSLWE